MSPMTPITIKKRKAKPRKILDTQKKDRTLTKQNKRNSKMQKACKDCQQRHRKTTLTATTSTSVTRASL